MWVVINLHWRLYYRLFPSMYTSYQKKKIFNQRYWAFHGFSNQSVRYLKSCGPFDQWCCVYFYTRKSCEHDDQWNLHDMYIIGSRRSWELSTFSEIRQANKLNYIFSHNNYNLYKFNYRSSTWWLIYNVTLSNLFLRNSLHLTFKDNLVLIQVILNIKTTI